MMMLQNYVISLAHAEARRQYIQTTFQQHNVAFQFFDALAPSEKMDALMKEYAPHLLENTDLNPTEKACLMSHVMLWKQCVDENLPYIGVFEDDVVLSEQANLFLNQSDWLKARFPNEMAVILRLETSGRASIYYPCPLISDYLGRKMVLAAGQDWCTAAYILSQTAAKWLLHVIHDLPAEAFKALDILMFGDFLFKEDLLITQIKPALAIQHDKLVEWGGKTANPKLASQLEPERIAKRKDWRARLWRALTKISREREKKRLRIIAKYEAKRSEIIPFE